MARPNPLAEAASKVGTAWAALSGLVSALVVFGVLSATQGEAVQVVGAIAPDTITALGTVIAGVTTAVGAVVAAFRTASAGKEHVTPVSSPMGADPRTGRLVPLVPATGLADDPYDR